MTALGEQIAADGYFNTVAIADLAITAGQVYKDDNGQIRVAGSPCVIMPSVASTGQVAAMTTLNGGNTALRGSGVNKW